MQSQLHRAVYKSTSELGAPLNTEQPAGSLCDSPIEVFGMSDDKCLDNVCLGNVCPC